ncbi:hypothetical protein C2E25_00685 [Geothermobacter hydrogeniphilus]|uniref:Uncharacterized protein n=1 Tax=Geothermobacter hydrogeniphilus TaxID=1969733 RepID=A0A2K2HER6_9BACT|nr:hypothetical protein [Geothermobacter hydrogeniphilus]PNU21778.1 hypothetical protein C2E25_00685 [Geothermobacter hydrogeniphilus]
MVRPPIIALLLVIGLSQPLHAARELEPNNSPEQATLVDPAQPITGTVEDQIDYYKIVLTATGTVLVRLDNYPRGADITLGINGFQENDSTPLIKKRGGGGSRLQLRFNARERVGLIWVRFTFADSVCREQWCAARLADNGPWYTTRPSPLAPAEWQGAPVHDAATYRLRIFPPGPFKNEDAAARKTTDIPGYRHFYDAAGGLTFEYPPDWRVSSEPRRRHWSLSAVDPSTGGMRIDLELRRRSDFPGSSAERQRNLAERDLTARGAEIRKRGTVSAAGHPAPYLVAVLRPSDNSGGETAHMQVIVPFADDYCWVSYSGPAAAYGEQIGVFENLLKTLRLQSPQREVNEPPKK